MSNFRTKIGNSKFQDKYFFTMSVYFPRNVIFLRERKNITQSEAAVALDIKRSTYANYESGQTSPSFDLLERFVLYFGIDAQKLLFEDLTDGNLIEVYPGGEKGNLKGNPIGNLMPQNGPEKPPTEGGNIPEIVKLLVESKDQLIKSQQVTIDTLNSLLDIKNQEITKITTENERLKRAVPEVGRDVADRSGEGSKKNIA